MAVNTIATTAQRTTHHAVAEILRQAWAQMTLARLGQMYSIPTNTSISAKWRRYKIPAVTAANYLADVVGGGTLTEGVTPASTTLDKEDFTATLQQIIKVITVTDLQMMTGEDDLIAVAKAELPEWLATVLEYIYYAPILTATTANRVFSGVATNDATVAIAADRDDVRAAVLALKQAYAKPITRLATSSVKNDTKSVLPAFYCVHNVAMTNVVRGFAGFTKVSDYGDPSIAVPGEYGAVDDVRFVESAVYGERVGAGQAVGGAPGVLNNGTNINLYDMTVFGQDAWGGVGLRGQHAAKLIVTPNKPSDSNPAEQRAHVTIKALQTGVVLQPAHMKRITCAAPI